MCDMESACQPQPPPTMPASIKLQVDKVHQGKGIEAMSPLDSDETNEENDRKCSATDNFKSSEKSGESCSSRTREHHNNRRKSDPIPLKKILKREPESDEENDHDASLTRSNTSQFEPDFNQEQINNEINNVNLQPSKSQLSSNFRRESRPVLNSCGVSEDEEMCHLAFTNYPDHLASAFESLLENESFCDVTLICDGGSQSEGGDRVVAFKAHKIVLSASSEYFYSILLEHPCSHPTIVLNGYAVWEVKALVDFMYRGQVDVGTRDQAQELINSAESLQIRGLAESLSKSNLTPVHSKSNNNCTINKNNDKISVEGPLGQSDNAAADETIGLNLSRSYHKRSRTDQLEVSKQSPESLNGNHSSESDLYSISPTKHIHNMPRRKQARPRRLSGDYQEEDLNNQIDHIHQNLSKLAKSSSRSCSSSPPPLPQALDLDFNDSEPEELDLDQEVEEDFHNFPSDEEILREVESFPMNMHIANLNHLLGGRITHLQTEPSTQRRRPGRPRRILTSTPPPSTKNEMNSGCNGDVVGSRGRRRRSSRLHYGESSDCFGKVIPDHHNNRDVNPGHLEDHDEHIIDYTTNPGFRERGGRSGCEERDKKLGGGESMQNLNHPNEDHLQQQHLAFLRNYNWAMAQRERKLANSSDLIEHERGDSSHRNHLHSRTTLPPPNQGHQSNPSTPKQLSSSSSSPLFAFPHFLPPHPLPHPHPHSPNHTQSQNNSKTTPHSPSPSSTLPPPPHFFLSSSSPSMVITPLLDKSGIEERTSHSSPFSPIPIPHLNLDSGESGQRGGHNPGEKEPPREKRKNKERGGSGGGLNNHQLELHPGPHPPWLGHPPIFGRHRSQHSAPRGGPPRAWSNTDLTEALHNVWNKKMTTSQASRIFGIPYNSLLMYVRGKYGKSLKLDLLKKGLDLAMANNIAKNSTLPLPLRPPSKSERKNDGNSSPKITRPSKSPPPLNNNNGNNAGSISSPPTHNSNSATVSALLQSLHNNNNNNTIHHNKEREHNNNHHHSHHNHKSSSNNKHSQQNNGNPAAELVPLPPDYGSQGGNLPPGFNPFFFGGGDFVGNPNFPFASALQHILPPHLTSSLQQHLHNNNGPQPPHPLSHLHQGGPSTGQKSKSTVMDMD